MDDSSKSHDADLINAIRAGEVAYDTQLRVFYNPGGQYLYEDFSQRKLARWQRVKGRTVSDVNKRMQKLIADIDENPVRARELIAEMRAELEWREGLVDA